MGIAPLIRIHICFIDSCCESICIDELSIQFNWGSDMFHEFMPIKMSYVYVHVDIDSVLDSVLFHPYHDSCVALAGKTGKAASMRELGIRMLHRFTLGVMFSY